MDQEQKLMDKEPKLLDHESEVDTDEELLKQL